MSDIPQATIDAAYAAYQKAWVTRNQASPLFAENVVRDVLEAAAPHLRRDEQAKLQPAIDRVASLSLAAQKKAAAGAAAAERERIAALARRYRAIIPADKRFPGQSASFADLIRGEATGA